MPKLKLTKRNVDHIIPGQRTAVHYDTDLTGFGVRVMPSGTKTWVIEYRPGSGGRSVATRRLAIGSTRIVTPDQARQNAKELLASVELGSDPAAARTSHRQMPKFSQFAERYLEEEGRAKLKPRSLTNYGIYLRKHAFPELGSKKLHDIAISDVDRLHRQIGRQHPVTANRVLECMSSVFRYAATCGLVPRGHNPTRGVSPFRETRRERFLSGDELARLGEALREAETIGIPWEPEPNRKTKHAPGPEHRRVKFTPEVVASLRLLTFTGARLREILHLRWAEVDLERGLLLLPDSKTGRKTIVLNGPAIEVLSDLPRQGVFVIPGEDGTDNCEKPRADLKRPWSSISKRAGLEGVRIHDLRHTFASFAAGANLGLPVIGRLLGHTQSATTARYAHLADDPLRRAAETIGSAIASAMSGSAEPPKPQPVKTATAR